MVQCFRMRILCHIIPSTSKSYLHDVYPLFDFFAEVRDRDVDASPRVVRKEDPEAAMVEFCAARPAANGDFHLTGDIIAARDAAATAAASGVGDGRGDTESGADHVANLPQMSADDQTAHVNASTRSLPTWRSPNDISFDQALHPTAAADASPKTMCVTAHVSALLLVMVAVVGRLWTARVTDGQIFRRGF